LLISPSRLGKNIRCLGGPWFLGCCVPFRWANVVGGGKSTKGTEWTRSVAVARFAAFGFWTAAGEMVAAMEAGAATRVCCCFWCWAAEDVRFPAELGRLVAGPGVITSPAFWTRRFI